ncbi:MAG: UbiA family prenyltransferase [Hyphomonadaceae bacterium]|nr:UbiA family prenyltransferase [Hyphomonadaceae bacterium]
MSGALEPARASSVPVREGAAPLPLVVDMDGTLIATDVLGEGIVAGLFAKPLSTLGAFTRLLGGRAPFKRRIAEIDAADIDVAPLRPAVVDWLRAQKAAGRAIHLVSAADETVARRVADRVGVFDSVQGSCGAINLKSARKADALRERFPEGYVYAGDSGADLPVWKDAAGIVMVGARPAVARRARALGLPVEKEFDVPDASLNDWRRALRLHQWAKNLLVFVPLMLSGQYRDPAAIVAAVLAFSLLSIAASGTYLLNDLADLGADRRHRTKHRRPLAAGVIPVQQGAIAALGMIAGALVVAISLAPPLAAVLVAYLIVTLAYSFRFKRTPFLDVFLLGALYTMRLVVGVVALNSVVSAWLLSFSMMFFFSMSLAKRHVEVAAAPPGAIAGRGYRGEDAPLTLVFGVASTVGSVLIMITYLMEEAFPSGLYSAPVWLWAAPALVSLWTMRIWLLAHRGELDDDPVAFAVRDRPSLVMGAVLVVAFALAIVM